VSQNSVFTPVEKLEVQTIGSFVLNFKISACSSLEWPVVPMTMAFLCREQSAAMPAVAAWSEKSIITSALAMVAGKSSPLSTCATISMSRKFFAHATSACPMRPFEPTIIVRVIQKQFGLDRVSPHQKYKFQSSTPQRFIVVRSTSQFFGFIGTRGKRYSSSINFIIASAAFTGVGFVSINKSLNNG